MAAGISYELPKAINSMEELRQLVQLIQRIIADIETRLTAAGV